MVIRILVGNNLNINLHILLGSTHDSLAADIVGLDDLLMEQLIMDDGKRGSTNHGFQKKSILFYNLQTCTVLLVGAATVCCLIIYFIIYN